MYSVTVRDHFMIAHSFTGEGFGPAQRLHGATYVVDLTLMRAALGDDDLVVNIDAARQVLQRELAELNMRNLDDEPSLAGRNTSTEFLARLLFDRVAAAIHAGAMGNAARALERARVTLAESHIAWASYEHDL